MKKKIFVIAVFLLIVIAALVFITRYNSNSSPLEDFVITNGVLEDYIGPGGDVVIPRKVKEIGISSFWRCRTIISVTIPSTVNKIGGSAFADCSDLTEVIISEGVKIIEDAFDGCSSLEKITIPKSVKEIGDYAFWYCPKVTIYGESGSYAEQYAKENGIPFKAR